MVERLDDQRGGLMVVFCVLQINDHRNKVDRHDYIK